MDHLSEAADTLDTAFALIDFALYVAKARNQKMLKKVKMTPEPALGMVSRWHKQTYRADFFPSMCRLISEHKTIDSVTVLPD